MTGSPPVSHSSRASGVRTDILAVRKPMAAGLWATGTLPSLWSYRVPRPGNGLTRLKKRSTKARRQPTRGLKPMVPLNVTRGAERSPRRRMIVVGLMSKARSGLFWRPCHGVLTRGRQSCHRCAIGPGDDGGAFDHPPLSAIAGHHLPATGSSARGQASVLSRRQPPDGCSSPVAQVVTAYLPDRDHRDRREARM